MMRFNPFLVALCILLLETVLGQSFTFAGYELLEGLTTGICRGVGWTATGKGYTLPQGCADLCDADPNCSAFDLARSRTNNGVTTYDCYIFFTQPTQLDAVYGGGSTHGCYKKIPRMDADIVVQCDDVSTVFRSDDGGATFTQIGGSSGWTSIYQGSLSSVTASTVIRVRCVDTGAVVAGFMGQIEVGNDVYVTTNPITDGNWERTAMSNPEDPSYVYTPWGGGRWGAGASSAIDPSAYWIWNSLATGWQQFDFDFGDIWCELAGLNLLSVAHECTCLPQCTGGYCNTLQFAVDRLGDYLGTSSTSICKVGQCCCSCPNCKPYYSV